jgi:hypothetical protein
MFFSIAFKPQQNFPCAWQLGNLICSTDQGWQMTTLGNCKVLFKGYTEQAPIEQMLPVILQNTRPLGNFCAIALHDNQVTVHTDYWRSFPIWTDANREVTNLQPVGQQAWCDATIICDSQLNITTTYRDVIGLIDSTTLEHQQVLEQVDAILLKRITDFVNQRPAPLRVFLSGGVDTMLIYSYLQRIGAEHELIDYLHVDYDDFWRKNSHHLDQFWGYSQIHHWLKPAYLASGAPGDEFMLRSPVTANLYLIKHGSSIPDQLKLNPDCMHREYFNRKKHLDIFSHQAATQIDTKNLYQYLCNVVSNDYQHWHIGHTLTWTPLRDLEIFKLMLRLPFESAVAQIMNSEFSKELIERNCPGLSSWISDQKNTGAAMKNIGSIIPATMAKSLSCTSSTNFF